MTAHLPSGQEGGTRLHLTLPYGSRGNPRTYEATWSGTANKMPAIAGQGYQSCRAQRLHTGAWTGCCRINRVRNTSSAKNPNPSVSLTSIDQAPAVSTKQVWRYLGHSGGRHRAATLGANRGRALQEAKGWAQGAMARTTTKRGDGMGGVQWYSSRMGHSTRQRRTSRPTPEHAPAVVRS